MDKNKLQYRSTIDQTVLLYHSVTTMKYTALNIRNS